MIRIALPALAALLIGGPEIEAQDSKKLTPKQLQALVHMGHLWIGVAMYREVNGNPPRSLEDLVKRPKDSKQWPDGGFLVGGKVPKDPWGNDYQYDSKKARRPKAIWSWGADGKKGGNGVNRDLTLEDIQGAGKGGGSAQMNANERNASASLKTLATAQADFKSNDRDLNRVNDFWTLDVAGLYAIDNNSVAGANAVPIKLIELSIALADQNPSAGGALTSNGNYPNPVAPTFGIQSAKAGYWYRALTTDNSPRGGPQPYAADTDGSGDKVHNTSRFGFCAIPEMYGVTGKLVFIINEGNTIFYRDFGKDVLKAGAIPPALTGVWTPAWPSNEELKNHWKRMR